MKEFGNFVSKKWNISEELATLICEHFEKGDSVYYLNDYNPQVAAELDLATLFDIFRELTEINNLSPKKKRVITTLTKAESLTSDLEQRVKFCISSVELDDMLLPFRSNARSKAQIAIGKGLGPLADIVSEQEIEDGTLDDLAQEYVGKDSTLATAADVIQGVKDILVERYAYDETARSMVRDYGYEDGYFEIIPKVKKDKRFLAYRGKMVPVSELTSEEFLSLYEAEQEKHIRLKHGVQLFHIAELLRHHFIENPDAIGYDLICEAIDECWQRILQPLVERDVKDRVYQDAEKWVLGIIAEELTKKLAGSIESGSFLALGKYNDKMIIVVAIDKDGNLLGATTEALTGPENEQTSVRTAQFINRYRPETILIKNNECADAAEAIAQRTLLRENVTITVQRYSLESSIRAFLASPWMQERCTYLEEEMQDVYASALLHIQPFAIIPQVGIQHFSIHPLQKFVRAPLLEQLLNLKITEKELQKGIPYIEAPDSVLQNISCVPQEVLAAIRREGVSTPFTSKSDLAKVDGMTELIFRNIAGYIVVPNAPNALDRTLVHPEFYSWINDISLELNASIESLINEPDRIRIVDLDNFAGKMYLDQKLPEQLRYGQKYPMVAAGSKHRQKLRLSELQEGTIVTGRVTNITKFGVFVDINAVCDGLIHISQLADGYIETADQVVKPDDVIDVRILTIDKKKRRVSLSMKKLGSKAPKIRPSQGQLTNLADYFKNR